MDTSPVGRFAPSPTGALHFGSLCTALASFCHIKSLGGRWILRFEDTDFERCTPKYCADILQDLHNLRLYPDVIYYQSKHISDYLDAISDIKNSTYSCTCSRKTLAPYAIYPRFCLHKPANTKSLQKTRLILPNCCVVFKDNLAGMCAQNLQQQLGDVVIKRSNGVINYIFSAAFDDAVQNITHIMRGRDLLFMTGAQIYIQKRLGLYQGAHYYHLPLAYNHQGQKLSKQNGAQALNTKTGDDCRRLLLKALGALGQDTEADLLYQPPEQIIAHAIRHWRLAPLVGAGNIAFTD